MQQIEAQEEREQELIRRILRGESDRYAELVDRYARMIQTLVARIIDRPEEAEEVTQDVFVKAFRQLGSFSGRSSFQTWIYRIACNTALSHARRTRRRNTLTGIDERRLGLLPDEEVERLEEWVAHERQLEALTRAVARLEADERALITLFYYEERSVSECAAILGLQENNVKVRLHRIRKKLYLLVMEETDGRDETNGRNAAQ